MCRSDVINLKFATQLFYNLQKIFNFTRQFSKKLEHFLTITRQILTRNLFIIFIKKAKRSNFKRKQKL